VGNFGGLNSRNRRLLHHRWLCEAVLVLARVLSGLPQLRGSRSQQVHLVLQVVAAVLEGALRVLHPIFVGVSEEVPVRVR